MQAGIYGATRWGPAYVAVDFAFTNHWMSTDHLAFGGGRLEGGYRFQMLLAGVAPYAVIPAQSFHTPSYSETGTIPDGFGLALTSRDATDTRSELGARFDHAWAVFSDAVLVLPGRLTSGHDWVSEPTLTPLFQSLPGASFVVNGATPPHNSALTSLGAELRFANHISLLAKFDGEFGSHSSTYAGTGTVRHLVTAGLRFRSQPLIFAWRLKRAVSMNQSWIVERPRSCRKKSACTPRLFVDLGDPADARPSQGAVLMTMCASTGSNFVDSHARRLPHFRSACVNEAVAERLGVRASAVPSRCELLLVR